MTTKNFYMDLIIKEENFIGKGRMKKNFFDMTDEEKEVWRRDITENTKRTLFAKGQPLVYSKDGVMVAEYEDGRVINV